MTKELKKAEQAAHAYDGLGAPMSHRPHVAELRRQVLGPDFNGVTRAVPERWSCEPVLDAKALKDAEVAVHLCADDADAGTLAHAAIRAYLGALSHPAALSGGDSEPVATHRTAGETIGDPMTVGYTNWRGEYAVRTITPRWLWFGATEWHKEPQWLITAYDNERGVVRDFALTGFASPPPEPVQGVTEAMVKRAATEYLLHRGERPWRVLRGGQELWETHMPAMRAALRAALATAPEGKGGAGK